MSEKSFQELRPHAYDLHLQRLEESEQKSVTLLSDAICYISAGIATFGVCMGSWELLACSFCLGYLSKVLKNGQF